MKNCRDIKRIEIPRGSDFKIVVKLLGADGGELSHDAIRWELHFASRYVLGESYVIDSSQEGEKWFTEDDPTQIRVPIPSGHKIREGELCCKLRYSLKDSEFPDKMYDHESVWVPVEIEADGRQYRISIVSGSKIGVTNTLDTYNAIYRLSLPAVTPHIGENGTWWVGGVDTGEKASGKSAYEYALDGGYLYDERQFSLDLSGMSDYRDWLRATHREVELTPGEGMSRISAALAKETYLINERTSGEPYDETRPLSQRIKAIEGILSGELDKRLTEYGFGYAINDLIEKAAISYEITKEIKTLKDWESLNVSTKRAVLFIKELDTSEEIQFYNTWEHCAALISFPKIDTSKNNTFYYTWRGCAGLVSFPQINTENVQVFTCAWEDCVSLVYFPRLDASHATFFSSTWNRCSSLTHFGGLIGVKVSFGLPDSPLLTRESCLNIFNELVDLTGQTTQSVTLHAEAKARLTEEDIAIATSKNWTIK